MIEHLDYRTNQFVLHFTVIFVDDVIARSTLVGSLKRMRIVGSDTVDSSQRISINRIYQQYPIPLPYLDECLYLESLSLKLLDILRQLVFHLLRGVLDADSVRLLQLAVCRQSGGFRIRRRV